MLGCLQLPFGDQLSDTGTADLFVSAVNRMNGVHMEPVLPTRLFEKLNRSVASFSKTKIAPDKNRLRANMVNKISFYETLGRQLRKPLCKMNNNAHHHTKVFDQFKTVR